MCGYTHIDQYVHIYITNVYVYLNILMFLPVCNFHEHQHEEKVWQQRMRRNVKGTSNERTEITVIFYYVLHYGEIVLYISSFSIIYVDFISLDIKSNYWMLLGQI